MTVKTKRSGCIAAFLVVTAVAVAAWGSAPVTVPHRFHANQVAVAAHVNQNFAALAGAIEDNGDRIEVLESDVPSLGSALHFLPQSDAPEELGQIAQWGYDTARSGFDSGLVEAEDVCRWSERLQESEYLGAGDDAGRLLALDDHATRMIDLRDAAYARFDVGLISIIEVRAAEYCALSAATVAEGFAARTGL